MSGIPARCNSYTSAPAEGRAREFEKRYPSYVTKCDELHYAMGRIVWPGKVSANETAAAYPRALSRFSHGSEFATS
jgi:hypothetical protein